MAVIDEQPRLARAASQPGTAAPVVAYVMSRFPKLTETFILYEILALQELGIRVEVYPLLREREPSVHPEALKLAQLAHYQPFASWAILRSQLWFLTRRPRRYLGALWTVASRTLGSANYFVGGLAIFPKVTHAARLMKEAGVQHVHCHFSNHPAAAGLVIHRLTGIPYTFTAHGSDLHVDRHMLREKVAEAERVVTISDYNRRLILAECGEEFAEKVVVVRCGIDPAVFRPRKGTLPEGPSRIVCVASFEEVKGHRYLIDACKILEDRGVDFRCSLIGRGPLLREVERRIAQLGLADRVVVEGPKTRNEVAEMVASADVAVCPSVREGLPVSLMEAMASGVPVVATEITGIPELIENDSNGLLVRPGDPKALADAIATLCDDSDLRRRLAEAGLATVRRDYDLRRNAARLTALLVSRGAA